ncbi:MAG: DMT family transporter [Litoreibacter sp.]|nr:DMT family transporter [Litoreibacter sp.]
MRLFLLTALTMVAFAANSVLNRLALADGAIGPGDFAAIRLSAGAVILWILVQIGTGPRLPRLQPVGAAALLVYVLGFSYAYTSLETGVGALILFGGVQFTMFAGAALSREQMPPARWIGALVAFGGLVYLLWPGGAAAPELLGSALMIAAALGWGVYSLHGRGAVDPVAATASNFIYATPIGLAVALLWPDLEPLQMKGVWLAVVSGALTSGLGYALWYSVLPRLPATVAGTAQLTVPIIALGGGILFLGEAISLRFGIASVLVLGGVALSLRK